MRFLAFLLCGILLTGCIDYMFKAADYGQSIGKKEAWKTLAMQGDAEAQYKVAEEYCCGDRPRYDNVQALFWYCKAARQNQRDALLTVGELYEHAHDYKGSIVPRNNTMALAYYSLAVKYGNDDAVIPYKELEPELSEAERKDVAELLEAWPNIPCEVYR